MNGMTICEHEASLLAALAAGHVDESLAAHAAHCPACREARAVWSAMQQAALADAPAALPAPGLIWWKAQLTARRAAVAKAGRPVRAMQWTAAAAVLVGLPLWANLTLGEPAAVLAAVSSIVFLAIPAGGLLYYWKRG